MEVFNENHRHFKIYKPYGYLSQFMSNASKQQSKKFLGSLFDFPEGIMAIGVWMKNRKACYYSLQMVNQAIL